jgi:succinate-semialdehyde dehydrogenase/glutarate-semialdehyde dehydrogenase
MPIATTNPATGRAAQGRVDVEELVADAVGKGATVLVGTRPDGPGWFYPPTLLTGITKDMRMYAEEVFGPVAQLHRVADLDEAIALANDTEFGLGSNAWTNDPLSQLGIREFCSAKTVWVG